MDDDDDDDDDDGDNHDDAGAFCHFLYMSTFSQFFCNDDDAADEDDDADDDGDFFPWEQFFGCRQQKQTSGCHWSKSCLCIVAVGLAGFLFVPICWMMCWSSSSGPLVAIHTTGRVGLLGCEDFWMMIRDGDSG